MDLPQIDQEKESNESKQTSGKNEIELDVKKSPSLNSSSQGLVKSASTDQNVFLKSSSVVSGSVTMPMVSRDGTILSTGEQLLRVYLMDGSYKAIKVDPTSTTVEELWEIASEKLMLSQATAPLFFLWGVRGDLELLLYTHQKISDIYRDWNAFEKRYNPQEAVSISQTISRTISKKSLSQRTIAPNNWEEPVKLIFRTTSVLPVDEELKFNNEASAVHLFYIQAVHNVIHSNYPCSLETAIKLGGVQLQLTLGNLNPLVHKTGYLRDYIGQYIPEHLLEKMKPEEFEHSLSVEHAKNKDKDKMSLELAYLGLVRQWKHYGCTFFKAKYLEQDSVYFKHEFEGKVRIGVNQFGVHIVDPKELKIVTHKFESIVEWDSEKTVFYFEAKVEESGKGGLFGKMKKKESKMYRFKSKQAELINDLVCDWMNELEMSSQLERRKKKATNVPVETGDDFLA